jgi:hypothetical protein
MHLRKGLRDIIPLITFADTLSTNVSLISNMSINFSLLSLLPSVFELVHISTAGNKTVNSKYGIINDVLMYACANQTIFHSLDSN